MHSKKLHPILPILLDVLWHIGILHLHSLEMMAKDQSRDRSSLIKSGYLSDLGNQQE
jgi:hypothetical protein